MQGKNTFDVAVVGGGPAGASAAMRLSRFGFDVAICDRLDSARQHVGESLPSSIRVVFDALALELPGDVVVARPPEHLVYWGEMRGSRPWTGVPESETSLLVWRGPFDRYLRERASSLATLFEASVRRALRTPEGWRVETADGDVVHARILLDASGRSGLLARSLREKERRFRTLALTGHFGTAEAAPPTLIESFEHGFVWSAPLANGLRDVTVMIDPPSGRADRSSLYQRAIESADQAKRLVSGLEPVDRVRGIDATPYGSRRYGGPDFFLVGDAASFLDPLSAHGVHKAMDSALAAAVSVRTMLERPERTEDAIAFYQMREETIVRVTSARLGALYRSETRFSGSPFWRCRSGSVSAPAALPPRRPLRASDALRAASNVRLVEAPVIENDFIERREVLVSEGGERPVRFLGAVCLPELFREVVSASSVETAAHRSALGFDRAYAAIDWLYRSGYLEPRGEDEL